MTDTPLPAHNDAGNLAGVAHPTRVRILAILRTDGPTTATALAARLGLNSGATSYHLRQLAEHGFVVDDPERGNRRERWWKAAQDNTAPPVDGQLADDTGLGVAYLRSIALVQSDNMQAAVDALPALPAKWRAPFDLSDYVIRLTPEGAAALGAELHAVLRRHAAQAPPLQDPAEGTARVTVQLQMFPDLGDADR
ncbi:winged helix-turn-helix domain-containing protein [Phytomonospora sp. NPDC050363]|uniref:ArsR/SmtB family transcription factor n=1 Tax=Phytomonospora sp. NPDC050363 TaxID=3155642 RepID=UPI0033C976B1